MTGLEIALLTIGLIVIVASFVFSSKSDGDTMHNVKDVTFTDKQKEDIKKQIMDILDEQIENVKEQTEISLDKLSNQKMLEMNEYSDTILQEINRNHNEVMFLYDMLNEKKKEINNTVRDMNVTKKEIEKSKTVPKKQTVIDSIKDMSEDTGGFMASEELLREEQKDVDTRKKDILNQLDAVVEAVSDDVSADLEAVEKKPKKRTSTGRTAAKRTKETVKKETLREDNRDPKAFETGNNNEKILQLSKEGKSNVEIAKELGLGIGEVKLVIDLFKGGK
ncbi:putative uncharacterized protein [Eshraghiella crossota CAG:259]|uniref:Uncharacterized protein n=1 Tax=Eshraghiella crossota CAG:259 TaxID=1263062 RepID=R5LS60_9FIRM|nr:putative uncharacterized protein [Butyrivibrio crossotus CAG:259]